MKVKKLLKILQPDEIINVYYDGDFINQCKVEKIPEEYKEYKVKGIRSWRMIDEWTREYKSVIHLVLKKR